MLIEDKKSFHIPIAPKPISVTLLNHKEIKSSDILKSTIVESPKIQSQVNVAQLAIESQKNQFVNQYKLTKESHYKNKYTSLKKAKRKGKNSSLSLNKTVIEPKNNIQYSLQLATFSNISWANKLLRKLKKQDFDAYLMQRNSKSGKQYTLVMVGRLSSKSEAKILQKKLDKIINVNSIIIKHI